MFLIYCMKNKSYILQMVLPSGWIIFLKFIYFACHSLEIDNLQNLWSLKQNFYFNTIDKFYKKNFLYMAAPLIVSILGSTIPCNISV